MTHIATILIMNFINTFAGIYKGFQGRNEVGQSVRPQAVVAGLLTIAD